MVLLGSGPALADDGPGGDVLPARSGEAARQATPLDPQIHHAPVSTAVSHQALEVTATIDEPQRVRYAGLVYRRADGTLQAAPFQRGVQGYIAVVPAKDVAPPGLAYSIELEDIDGRRVAAFASREAPQPVVVVEDRMDARERAQFDRLEGRRSVAGISSEFVRFGSTSGARALPCAAGGEGCRPGERKTPTGIEDQYWRVEASYTYRPLRTVAEFSIRGGVVRGRSLVSLEEYDESKYDVGLNYGSPQVRFRLSDSWHLETELLTSVTETGFSVGTGGALLIGDPYGSRLTLGFETIGLSEGTYFGSRFYSRMDIAAGPRVLVAPVVEVTDMPHAEAFGVRLLGEVGANLGRGFVASVRGGYQARKSTSGGPAFGGSLGLAF